MCLFTYSQRSIGADDPKVALYHLGQKPCLSLVTSTMPQSSGRGRAIETFARDMVSLFTTTGHETSSSHSYRAGDVVHVQILNTHIVVLGSPEVIFEYLDRRSANTSDREHTVMLEL